MGYLGQHRQSALAVPLLVQEHDVLDQRAYDLHDPLAGLQVRLGVRIRGEPADDEGAADRLDAMQGQGEPRPSRSPGRDLAAATNHSVAR
jgi:hypothetical protein